MATVEDTSSKHDTSSTFRFYNIVELIDARRELLARLHLGTMRTRQLPNTTYQIDLKEARRELRMCLKNVPEPTNEPGVKYPKPVLKLPTKVARGPSCLCREFDPERIPDEPEEFSEWVDWDAGIIQGGDEGSSTGSSSSSTTASSQAPDRDDSQGGVSLGGESTSCNHDEGDLGQPSRMIETSSSQVYHDNQDQGYTSIDSADADARGHEGPATYNTPTEPEDQDDFQRAPSARQLLQRQSWREMDPELVFTTGDGIGATQQSHEDTVMLDSNEVTSALQVDEGPSTASSEDIGANTYPISQPEVDENMEDIAAPWTPSSAYSRCVSCFGSVFVCCCPPTSPVRRRSIFTIDEEDDEVDGNDEADVLGERGAEEANDRENVQEEVEMSDVIDPDLQHMEQVSEPRYTSFDEMCREQDDLRPRAGSRMRRRR